jgi:hypothetical protein
VAAVDGESADDEALELLLVLPRLGIILKQSFIKI